MEVVARILTELLATKIIIKTDQLILIILEQVGMKRITILILTDDTVLRSFKYFNKAYRRL